MCSFQFACVVTVELSVAIGESDERRNWFSKWIDARDLSSFVLFSFAIKSKAIHIIIMRRNHNSVTQAVFFPFGMHCDCRTYTYTKQLLSIFFSGIFFRSKWAKKLHSKFNCMHKPKITNNIDTTLYTSKRKWREIHWYWIKEILLLIRL